MGDGTVKVDLDVDSSKGVANAKTTGMSIGKAVGDGAKSGSAGAGESIGKSISTGVAATAGAIGGAVSSVVSSALSAVSSSIGDAVSRVDTINNFPKVMENLGYTADNASSAIDTMSTHLQGLPTTLNSMVSLVQELTASTGNLDEATQMGLSFNDMLLASGASSDAVSSALYQYNQMVSTGTVDQEAWQSLVQAAPGQMDQLAKSILGANAGQGQLYAAMQDGTVTMDQFNAAVIDLDTNGADGFASFAQQAKDATNGIATAWTNVQTSISRSLANIIQAIGASQIAALINGIGTDISIFGKTVVVEIGNAKVAIADFSSAIAPSLTMVSNVFKDTKDLVGGAFDEMVSQIGVGIDIIMPNIQGFASSFNEVFATILANAGLIISNVAGLLMDLGTSIIPALAPYIDGVSGSMMASKDVISNVADAIDTVIQAMDTAVSSQGFIDWMNKIFTVVGTVAGSFGDLVYQIAVALNSIMPSIEGFVSSFNTTFGTLISGAGTVISDIAGLIMDLGTSVIPAIQPAIDGASSAMQMSQPVISAVAGAIGEVIQAIDEAVSNPAFVTWVTDISTAVGNFFISVQGVYQALVPIIQQVADSAAAIIGPLFEQMESIDIAGIIDTISTKLQELAGFINDNKDIIAAAVVGILAAVAAYEAYEIAMGIWKAITIAGTIVQGLFNAVMDANPISIIILAVIALVAALVYFFTQTDLGKQIWSDFSAAVVNVWNAISGAFFAVWNPIVDFFTVTIPGAIATMGQFFADLPGNIGTWLAGVITAVADWASGVVDYAINAGADFLSAIVNAFQQIPGNISDLLSQIPGLVMGVFDDAGTWLLDAGSNIMNGLWNGIQDVWNGISDFFSGIGDWIVEHKGPPAYDAVMLVNNGKLIMKGLGKGLTDGMSYVEDALADVQGIINPTADIQVSKAYDVSASLSASSAGSAAVAVLGQLTAKVDSLTESLGQTIKDNAGISSRDMQRMVTGAVR